jgi:hypothetical protein
MMVFGSLGIPVARGRSRSDYFARITPKTLNKAGLESSRRENISFVPYSPQKEMPSGGYIMPFHYVQ